MAQGLSADTLLSSAVDEDGVLVRRCCRASLKGCTGLAAYRPHTERQGAPVNRCRARRPATAS